MGDGFSGKQAWMTEDYCLERKLLKPHIGKCCVSGCFHLSVNDSLYSRKDSMSFDHLPRPVGTGSLSILLR